MTRNTSAELLSAPEQNQRRMGNNEYKRARLKLWGKCCPDRWKYLALAEVSRVVCMRKNPSNCT